MCSREPCNKPTALDQFNDIIKDIDIFALALHTCKRRLSAQHGSAPPTPHHSHVPSPDAFSSCGEERRGRKGPGEFGFWARWRSTQATIPRNPGPSRTSFSRGWTRALPIKELQHKIPLILLPNVAKKSLLERIDTALPALEGSQWNLRKARIIVLQKLVQVTPILFHSDIVLTRPPDPPGARGN